jgi:hypothetical protein
MTNSKGSGFDDGVYWHFFRITVDIIAHTLNF